MVSVAMATYNGEKYINRQLKSVLINLSENDEIIISDDGSSDRTIEFIKSFNDKRINILKGPRKGLVKNFANAIDHCTGDFIFLCDQDDYWYPNKVSCVLKIFEKKKCILVEHDAKVLDEKGNIIFPSFFSHRKVRNGVIRNFLRNTYHGCLMAFRKELKEYLHPYPLKGCLHDQWIGLIAESHGECYFYKKKLMNYIRHADNYSSFKRLPLNRQLMDRIYLFYFLFKHYILSIKR